MIFDYAKVRAVVEDRRSMLGAIGAAVGFIRRNSGAAVGLFLLNFRCSRWSSRVYALVAPGAGAAGVTMWLAFGLGQVYIARAAVGEAGVLGVRDGAVPEPPRARRLRGAPGPAWPDSPAADAIQS